MKSKNLTDIRKFSLLAPDENSIYFKLGANTATDLSVDFITESISGNSTEQSVLKKILLEMPTDEKTINYRREIYSELRDNVELCGKLYDLYE